VAQRLDALRARRRPRGLESRSRGGAALASACLQARELLLARSELVALEQAPNQRSKFLIGQHCKLQQAGVQALELAFGQGVEVDAPNALLETKALQPPQENLGSTWIRDGALA
jgi:hypothetical protein